VGEDVGLEVRVPGSPRRAGVGLEEHGPSVDHRHRGRRERAARVRVDDPIHRDHPHICECGRPQHPEHRARHEPDSLVHARPPSKERTSAGDPRRRPAPPGGARHPWPSPGQDVHPLAAAGARDAQREEPRRRSRGRGGVVRRSTRQRAACVEVGSAARPPQVALEGIGTSRSGCGERRKPGARRSLPGFRRGCATVAHAPVPLRHPPVPPRHARTPARRGTVWRTRQLARYV
jgi:hypothetical protein